MLNEAETGQEAQKESAINGTDHTTINKISFKPRTSSLFLITVSNLENQYNLQEIMDKVVVKEKELSWAIISEEKHKSGNYHYHFALKFKKPVKVVTHKRFNYPLDKQANIQPNFSEKGTVDYVIKKGTYLTHMYRIDDSQDNVEEKTHENIHNKICELIMSGISIEDLIRECSKMGERYMLQLHEKNKQYKNMIHFNYECFAALKKGKKHVITTSHYELIKKIISSMDKGQRSYFFPQSHMEILDAIHKAIIYKSDRPHKTLNLHIFSKYANMGKTTFLTTLTNFFETYYYPPLEWFATYYNHKYSFIIWDEFTLPKDLQKFNLFFEGAPIDLSVKYSTNSTKVDNPLIICASNSSLRWAIEKTTKSDCKTCRGKPLDFSHGYDQCTYTGQALSMRSTTTARIKEIELTSPLFSLIELMKFVFSKTAQESEEALESNEIEQISEAIINLMKQSEKVR